MRTRSTDLFTEECDRNVRVRHRPHHRGPQNGDFVFYEEGKPAIILRAASGHPIVFSLNDLVAHHAYDDWNEPLQQFRHVATLGQAYRFHPKDKCTVAHPSEVPPGSLAIAPDVHGIMIAYKDNHSRYYIDFASQRAIHSDRMPVVGYFRSWSIVTPRAGNLSEQTFDFEARS